MQWRPAYLFHVHPPPFLGTLCARAGHLLPRTTAAATPTHPCKVGRGQAWGAHAHAHAHARAHTRTVSRVIVADKGRTVFADSAREVEIFVGYLKAAPMISFWCNTSTTASPGAGRGTVPSRGFAGSWRALLTLKLACPSGVSLSAFRL